MIIGLPHVKLNEPIHSWLCMSFVGCLILLLHLLSIVVVFYKGSRLLISEVTRRSETKTSIYLFN